MNNKITIQFNHSEDEFNCQIDSEAPFDESELNCCILSLIDMFSNKTGIPPIKITTTLQNVIIGNLLESVNDMTTDADNYLN